MRIRAAVLREPGTTISVEEVELDPPKELEVLVRVAAAGVCHSDVRLADGELGDERGATHTVPSGSATTAARVVSLTGRGVDHAFEVVGHPETMRLAWDCLRPGGTAVVVGLAPRGVEVSLPAIEFLSDNGIRGSYYGNGDPLVDLPRLADLALSGELDLASVVTSVEPLEAVNDALDRLRRGEGARTVLVVDRELAAYD